MPQAEWAAYLDTHSGLPGPRANLELVVAVALLADTPAIAALLADGGEYPTMCASAALGLHADDAASGARARELASDDRWRVREGVAIGLQLLGDRAPTVMASIVRTWVDDAAPLVQRAALAAICEPRLLRDPEVAASALTVCERATQQLVARSDAQRRTAQWRVLRKALGYCWSVAVAAKPDRGLVPFRALDTTDPDIAWIVAQNLRKKRLSSLCAE